MEAQQSCFNPFLKIPGSELGCGLFYARRGAGAG
jgi:hypothetical protein